MGGQRDLRCGPAMSEVDLQRLQHALGHRVRGVPIRPEELRIRAIACAAARQIDQDQIVIIPKRTGDESPGTMIGEHAMDQHDDVVRLHVAGFMNRNVDDRPVADHAVELVLDASGSMLQRIAGKTRIAIARDVLISLVNETIPDGTPFALRVFGHRKPQACDTELVAPLAPLERDRIAGIIRRTEAKNLAKTPIGESLALVAQDLAGADGPKLVILITDGEETCGGNPAGAIRELKQAGIEARLSVVGFAIDDAALKSEFESWARIGGGLYFDAADEDELGDALEAAMKPKFQVLDTAGEIIAEGTAGGDPEHVLHGAQALVEHDFRVKTLRES